jgi:uncharacterized protein YbbC (DUF1343 family)
LSSNPTGGTDTPFEIIGVPWLEGAKLEQALTAPGLPGVRFEAVVFTPEASKFQGERCQRVTIAITDRETFEPIRTGLEIARQLRALCPDDGKTVDQMESIYRAELEDFLQRRSAFLLYSP